MTTDFLTRLWLPSHVNLDTHYLVPAQEPARHQEVGMEIIQNATKKVMKSWYFILPSTCDFKFIYFSFQDRSATSKVVMKGYSKKYSSNLNLVKSLRDEMRILFQKIIRILDSTLHLKNIKTLHKHFTNLEHT